jgi:hypothetical protein
MAATQTTKSYHKVQVSVFERLRLQASRLRNVSNRHYKCDYHQPRRGSQSKLTFLFTGFSQIWDASFTAIIVTGPIP